MTQFLNRWLLIASMGLPLVSVQTIFAGDGAIRSFHAQKCQYKLPGPDWAWIDKQAPNVLFMAGDAKGFVVVLSFVASPDPTIIDQQFADGFEKTTFIPGRIGKRGARFITFKGLPCYQTEAILIAEEKTTASRTFTAHGFVYTLSLVGAKEPVEKDPGFKTVMDGFDFTVPPEQPPKVVSGPDQTPAIPTAQTSPVLEYSKALTVSEWMGRIAGVCIVVAIVGGLIRWVTRKRKSSYG
jgi:hypothetical protein